MEGQQGLPRVVWVTVAKGQYWVHNKGVVGGTRCMIKSGPLGVAVLGYLHTAVHTTFQHYI